MTSRHANRSFRSAIVVTGLLQQEIYKSGGEILVREGPGVFEAYQ